jgi:alpha-D-ribose 1-methylphosphonate 5-triphosphate diphosphatase
VRELGDVTLWPGLVDLHTDSLARFAHPRPGTAIPLDVALHDLVADAALHGVTSPFVCVSVGEGPDPARTDAHAGQVLAAVERAGGSLPVPVRVHLRVDVSAPGSAASARGLLARYGGLVALLSVMDHTPGRGQYREVAGWRTAMRARHGADDPALDRWLTATLTAGLDGRVDEQRREVAALAAEHGVVLASHDDDSAASVGRAGELGARISEFPLTHEAARTARRTGLGVVMGAPNAWRGGSHLTGLSARDALAAGTLDALTSDYHCGALIRAAHELAAVGACPLAEAVRLVTGAPARLVGLTDRGVIAPGARADLIAVRAEPVPTAVAVWSGGRQILRRA